MKWWYVPLAVFAVISTCVFLSDAILHIFNKTLLKNQSTWKSSEIPWTHFFILKVISMRLSLREPEKWRNAAGPCDSGVEPSPG
jgi:hypothetical protein